MEIWFTEYQTENLKMTCRLKETLFTGKSDFQDVAVVDTVEFGRMLVLDGVFQTSLFDEYVYHEMIAHIPLFTHPAPKKVLVIGGGDGGTIREVVRHAAVERAEMVEIDGLVVEACKRHLPEISQALVDEHPKVMLTIGDGIQHMKDADNEYDVIIVDCSDPIGPGEGLFTPDFYHDVYQALKPDGLFVQQTESPFYHQALLQRLYQDVKALFPITRLYLAAVPLYPGGTHSFTLGSKLYDPLQTVVRIPEFSTRYYNQDIYKSCFALPNFLRELLQRA